MAVVHCAFDGENTKAAEQFTVAQRERIYWGIGGNDCSLGGVLTTPGNSNQGDICQ